MNKAQLKREMTKFLLDHMEMPEYLSGLKAFFLFGAIYDRMDRFSLEELKHDFDLWKEEEAKKQ
jgi:hypothetical protein